MHCCNTIFLSEHVYLLYKSHLYYYPCYTRGLTIMAIVRNDDSCRRERKRPAGKGIVQHMDKDTCKRVGQMMGTQIK